MNTVSDLVARLENILPQTQCRQCGFDGCRPYATALAAGIAGIERCPPGGNEGAQRLAAALGLPARPVDPQYGLPKQTATRVLIDEAVCIGCTKCIQACPVDAIVGATQQMHTVMAAECTGCELCIAPCPVDCIAVVPAAQPAPDYHAHLEAQRPLAYRRYHARAERLARLQHEQTQARAQRRAQIQTRPTEPAVVATDVVAVATTAVTSASDPVARALAAAKARRAARDGTEP